MPYCHECGKEVKKQVKFCPACGTNLANASSNEEKSSRKHIEHHYHHEPKKEVNSFRSAMNGLGGLVLVLIILGGIIAAGLYFYQQGTVETLVDPCEKEFNECNHECGEGWFSGACKEKCSYDYRKCRK